MTMTAAEFSPRLPEGSVGSERSGIRPRVEGPWSPAEPPSAVPKLYGMSDRGCVRAQNQDHFLVADVIRSVMVRQQTFGSDLPTPRQVNQGQLLAVADGMGGYEGGELASAVALDTLSTYLGQVTAWLSGEGTSERGQTVRVLEMGVRAADEAVHNAACELGLDERMGTTLTAAYLAWPHAYILHVGDSRCHLLRAGQLQQITTDHTIAQELLTAKSLSHGQAATSALRHVLVNTVGGLRHKQLFVESHILRLAAGDQLLLSTDGLNLHVDDGLIMEALLAEETVEVRVRSLIEMAKAQGGRDNVTVLLAEF